jgi:hypothetical protein
MKTWTYLASTKYPLSISRPRPTPNPTTFEHVEIDETDETRLTNLTDGYIELINDGFFDGFSNDYNVLFVSKYDPTQNPIIKEKIFEMEFNNSTYYSKNKKQKN